MTDTAQERAETYPDNVHPIRIPKGHTVEIQEEQGRGLIRGTRVSMDELDRLRARQREEGDLLAVLESAVRDEVKWHDVLISWDHEDGFWLSTIPSGKRGAWAIETGSPHRSLRAAIVAAAEELGLTTPQRERARLSKMVHAIRQEYGRQTGDDLHTQVLREALCAAGVHLLRRPQREGGSCRICTRPTDGVTLCRYCDRMMGHLEGEREPVAYRYRTAADDSWRYSEALPPDFVESEGLIAEVQPLYTESRAEREGDE